MLRFIARRLLQSIGTVFGVMVITFVLFRVMAGDIAAAHVNEHATEQTKAEWRHAHGYDRPLLINIHSRLRITDLAGGDGSLSIMDVAADQAVDQAVGRRVADSLALLPPDRPDKTRTVRLGRFIYGLNRDTPLTKLTDGPVRAGRIRIRASDGSKFFVDVRPEWTAGKLIDRINNAPANAGKRVVADIARPTAAGLFDSQFVDHLYKAVTFQSRSLTDNRKLTTIIRTRAGSSLALTVPAMAMGWVTAMIISCLVAYYRDTWIDRVGVLLSVLGMCVPFLAYMIFGQWLMFLIAPRHAYGLVSRADIYVPIAIMVIAGLGGSVRFYRTILLNEIGRDYVRTAKAKGLPLPAILFKHVLKNCMLPILTNLILAIPFLIMGSLLVETYFGIPGLGNLLLSSVNGRDEPVLSGLVFLSALIYTVGLLLTDLSYALFDPRIRLR